MLDLLSALCLVFVLEGALYALFPDAMKRMLGQIGAVPASLLRSSGVVAAVLGLFFLWLIRG